jgi:hypothetical protein
METQALFDFSALTYFMDMEVVQQYKLALMEKSTLVSAEVIDGQNLSLVTHETKPLNVTIGSHTNKVVFNVI